MKHAVENLIPDENIVNRAYLAMITARSIGSIGATETHIHGDVWESTTVERINIKGWGENLVGSVAFRVLGEGNETVIVATGTEGQYTSHALSDLEQAIQEEIEADEYDQQHEPYRPDEDYFRSLIHDEDI